MHRRLFVLMKIIMGTEGIYLTGMDKRVLNIQELGVYIVI